MGEDARPRRGAPEPFRLVPELDLLHAGDLLFYRHNAFIDVSAGATMEGWDRSLAAAIAMCKPTTRVVAGHGPTTDRTGLQWQRDYFDRLREIVGAAIREGKPCAEVVKVKPPAMEGLGWSEMLPSVLGVVYDEIAGR